MLHSSSDYIRREVVPRAGRILAVPQPWLAGLASLLLLNGCIPSNLPAVKLSTFSSFFATYDTVVFGFCVAAVTITMAVPNTQFLEFLSKRKDHQGFTPFQDLIFVFSWTCFFHLLGFGFCFVLTFCFADSATFGQIATLGGFGLRWAALWVQFYCVLQFGVAAATVFQFADLYAQYLRTMRERKAGSPSEEPDPKG